MGGEPIEGDHWFKLERDGKWQPTSDRLCASLWLKHAISSGMPCTHTTKHHTLFGPIINVLSTYLRHIVDVRAKSITLCVTGFSGSDQKQSSN
jgi:hypothetical protein